MHEITERHTGVRSPLRFLARMATCAIIVASTGCLSIPAGHEIISRHEQPMNAGAPRPGEETQRLLGDIVGHDAVFHLFNEQETGAEHVSAEEEVVKREKRFIIGLFPGMFANWYGGVGTSSGMKLSGAGDYVADGLMMVVVAPLANAILAGLPTVGCWFTEVGYEWTPPAKRPAAQSIIQVSLIGWARTSRITSEMHHAAELPSGPRVERVPISDAVLKLSVPGTALEWTDITDGDGMVTFNLDTLAEKPPLDAVIRARTLDGTTMRSLPLPADVCGSESHLPLGGAGEMGKEEE